MESKLSEVPGPAEAGAHDDLEKLLCLAERIQEKCDDIAAKVSTARWYQMIVCFVFVLFVLVSFGARALPRAAVLYASLFSASFVAAGTGGFAERRIRELKRRGRQEARALSEVVQLLRETVPAVSAEEGWSALDMAQYQVRLSRLAT